MPNGRELVTKDANFQTTMGDAVLAEMVQRIKGVRPAYEKHFGLELEALDKAWKELIEGLPAK